MSRRTRPPRGKKARNRESQAPLPEQTTTIAPPADPVEVEAAAPRLAHAPADELAELDAGWDELLTV